MKQDDQAPKGKALSLVDDLYASFEREQATQKAIGEPVPVPRGDYHAHLDARLAPVSPVAAVLLGERLHPFFIVNDESGVQVFATWSGDRFFSMKGDATTGDHLQALRLQYGNGAVLEVQKVMAS
ncbi:hypothetical protein [Paraburkholderia youngii]|uniref:hypothetical protein n=1 Tax=Paraburkholderia youngii TaxID=2782701 RepID=UPI003D215D35